MIALLCTAAALFALELWMFCRATFIEPRRFTVEEQTLHSERISESADGLRIVQISDLHFADNDWKGKLEKLKTAVNRTNPDILVSQAICLMISRIIKAVQSGFPRACHR